MRYFIAIFVAAALVTRASATCNICTTRGIACISETDYQLCIDNKPYTANTYTCPQNEVCTNLGTVCAPATSNSPYCTSNCNLCDGTRAFACTSRTTFTLCSGLTPTGDDITCPNGTLCDTTTSTICLDECLVTTPVCDRPASTTTTVAPITIPSPSSPSSSSSTSPAPATTPIPSPADAAAAICAAQNTVGRFPYTNDTVCIDYVYCRYQGSVLTSIPSKCPSGSFFNRNNQSCQTTKPSWCT